MVPNGLHLAELANLAFFWRHQHILLFNWITFLAFLVVCSLHVCCRMIFVIGFIMCKKNYFFFDKFVLNAVYILLRSIFAGIRTLCYNDSTHLVFAGSTAGHVYCWDLRLVKRTSDVTSDACLTTYFSLLLEQLMDNAYGKQFSAMNFATTTL